MTSPKVVVNEQRAAQFQSQVLPDKRPAADRKYNIKLLRQDYEVIKLMAEAEGKSASWIVSYLLYEHVWAELLVLIGSSADALVLIACAADREASCDLMTTPWLYDVLREELDQVAAAMTGEPGADVGKLFAMVEKYRANNSHLFNIYKLMIEDKT